MGTKDLETLINRHNQRSKQFYLFQSPDREPPKIFFQDTFIKVYKTLKKGNYNEAKENLPGMPDFHII